MAGVRERTSSLRRISGFDPRPAGGVRWQRRQAVNAGNGLWTDGTRMRSGAGSSSSRRSIRRQRPVEDLRADIPSASASNNANNNASIADNVEPMTPAESITDTMSTAFTTRSHYTDETGPIRGAGREPVTQDARHYVIIAVPVVQHIAQSAAIEQVGDSEDGSLPTESLPTSGYNSRGSSSRNSMDVTMAFAQAFAALHGPVHDGMSLEVLKDLGIDTAKLVPLDLDHVVQTGVREQSTVYRNYQFHPAPREPQPWIIANGRLRSKSSFGGYIAINGQIVDPDSMEGVCRAKQGLPVKPPYHLITCLTVPGTYTRPSDLTCHTYLIKDFTGQSAEYDHYFSNKYGETPVFRSDAERVHSEKFIELSVAATSGEGPSKAYIEVESRRRNLALAMQCPKDPSTGRQKLEELFPHDINEHGDVLSNYSVERNPDPKPDREGLDLNHVPRSIFRNQPLAATTQPAAKKSVNVLTHQFVHGYCNNGGLGKVTDNICGQLSSGEIAGDELEDAFQLFVSDPACVTGQIFKIPFDVAGALRVAQSSQSASPLSRRTKREIYEALALGDEDVLEGVRRYHKLSNENLNLSNKQAELCAKVDGAAAGHTETVALELRFGNTSYTIRRKIEKQAERKVLMNAIEMWQREQQRQIQHGEQILQNIYGMMMTADQTQKELRRRLDEKFAEVQRVDEEMNELDEDLRRRCAEYDVREERRLDTAKSHMGQADNARN